jgi:RND superfamily putative drug exporter
MAAYSQLEQRARETGLLFPPFDVGVSPDGTVATLSVSLAGNGDDRRSSRALSVLRHEVIPAATRQLGHASAAVTGETAANHDFNAQMKTRMPFVFFFVLALAFGLLLLTFRSIVVPIKTIVLNLLSVGASYGVLVAIFQHRWAEGLLGFTSNGAVVSWLPLFLFVVLFGLSMDYHVFILSRVKELVDAGMPTDEAVAAGVKRTAGTVTSAAIVMVAVFAIFASLGSLELKQMGVGLAVAVLIDATIVRAVLLPATMKLLGEWNWYLPKRLEQLPSLAGERKPDAAPAEPAVATT